MIKKLIKIILCFSIITLSLGNDWMVKADDADFEENYTYYCQLCSSRGLSSEQKTLCAQFNEYLARLKEKMDNDIADIQGSIRELEANLALLSDKVDQIKEQISTVQGQMSTIQKSIEETEANIVIVEGEIADREAHIEEIDTGIRNRMEMNQSNVRLNKYVQFIMGASSFVDLLRRVSAVNDISEYDFNKMRELEEEKAKLELDKQELEDIKESLQAQKAALKAQEEYLKDLKAQNEELIRIYHAKAETLAAELESVQVDMSALEAQMKDISIVLDGFYPSPGFVAPVKSSFYVSSSFPYYEPGDPYSGFHPAADFAVNYGTGLYPVANGYVVYTYTGCGWGYLGSSCGYGFGNTIAYLIEVRGYIYLIINAHLSAVYVSPGDLITQGYTTLGLTGSSGSSSGPHLHVEVINMGSGWSIKDAIQSYLNVGRVYYTLGRNIYYTCAYKGAPCYENALDIFGVKYGYWY